MPKEEGEAFAALYQEHVGHVAAYVLRRCARDDAADIVSETFLVAWRRRGEMPTEPMTRAWLYGVARRVAANHRRGDRRRGRLADRVEFAIATSLRTEPDPGSWRAETGALTEALARLSAADREMLFLVAWEELSPAEVAEVLDLPAPIVHKRLYRARQRLHAVLDATSSADTVSDADTERLGVIADVR
ncbi:MAG: sigma-70 family RNA polymerase sigma factor [Actinomycetota bacterium]